MLKKLHTKIKMLHWTEYICFCRRPPSVIMCTPKNSDICCKIWTFHGQKCMTMMTWKWLNHLKFVSVFSLLVYYQNHFVFWWCQNKKRYVIKTDLANYFCSMSFYNHWTWPAGQAVNVWFPTYATQDLTPGTGIWDGLLLIDQVVFFFTVLLFIRLKITKKFALSAL